MPNNHKPIDSVDLSHLPKLNGRPVATAKQLAELSGRALSQVYATVRIGATKKEEGSPLLDAESYFDYMKIRKVGRPALNPSEPTTNDTATK